MTYKYTAYTADHQVVRGTIKAAAEEMAEQSLSEAGYNVITGETGAGKSILVTSLSVILGERANVEYIRHNADRAVIEAVFDIQSNPAVQTLLSENDIEEAPEITIRREVTVKGSNRCFVNDALVPLSVLKGLGRLIVDLHGQHEHQSLLRTARAFGPALQSPAG